MLNVHITVPEKGPLGRDVPKSHHSSTLPEGVHVLPVFGADRRLVNINNRRPKRLR